MGANAQTIVPTFTVGQVLTAAQQNQINTGVPVFATTVTRDAAFGGAGEKTLDEGQFCYIEASNRLQIYQGSAWRDYDTDWTSFTPAYTNLTVGNASNVGAYFVVGGFVYGHIYLAFGSTTSVSGHIQFNLPLTASNGTNGQNIGQTKFSDSGVGVFIGYMNQLSTTRGEFYVFNASGTYTTQTAVTATVPMTWTTNDEIFSTFMYRLP